MTDKSDERDDGSLVPRPYVTPLPEPNPSYVLSQLMRLDSQGRHFSESLARIEERQKVQSNVLKELKVPHKCAKDETFSSIKADLNEVSTALVKLSDVLSTTSMIVGTSAEAVAKLEKGEVRRRAMVIGLFTTFILAIITGAYYIGGLDQRVTTGTEGAQIAKQLKTSVEEIQNHLKVIQTAQSNQIKQASLQSDSRDFDLAAVQAKHLMSFCSTFTSESVTQIKRTVNRESWPRCPQFEEESDAKLKHTSPKSRRIAH